MTLMLEWRWTIRSDFQPPMFMVVMRSMPVITQWDAQWCRQSSPVKSPIPARSQAVANCRLTGLPPGFGLAGVLIGFAEPVEEDMALERPPTLFQIGVS
ncbi:hypothetical protein FHS93_001192 [Sphingobium francense]|nr:hypothetical protein [Sphingobium indicum]